MAFFSDTHHRREGVIERATFGLSHWLSNVANSMTRRRIARITYQELSALGDRELADLGLVRADLRRVALMAAQERL